MIIGEYIPGRVANEDIINRGWSGQGWIYKNTDVFDTGFNHEEQGCEPCYIPELSDSRYSYKDFMEMCDYNAELARELFNMLDWQHPETLLDEWEREEEELGKHEEGSCDD